MKKKNKFHFLLLLLFTTVFFVSAYMVCKIVSQAQQEQSNFERLEEMVKYPSAIYDSVLTQDHSEIKIGSSYKALKEQNPDFFGWIAIEGTELNYPVMHTPEDEEYYLHRNFDGETSQSGVPFLSAACYKDCGNYIIYGHNMKNGTMFASLLSYANPRYWEEHPVIQFDTLEENGEYEVLAVFYSQAYQQNAEGVFRYYQYTDLSTPDQFAEYIKQIRHIALYDTGIQAEYGDQLITLSTCSYHTKNGRFVVVAKKGQDSSRKILYP